MPHSPQPKILAALALGDTSEALRLAAKFPHLGEHKEAITRGWAALQRPEFYREIGHDPEALVQAGLAAVRARYAA